MEKVFIPGKELIEMAEEVGFGELVFKVQNGKLVMVRVVHNYKVQEN